MRFAQGLMPRLAAALGIILILSPAAFLALHRVTFDVRSGGIIVSALLAVAGASLIVAVVLTLRGSLPSHSRVPYAIGGVLAALQSAGFLVAYLGSYYTNQFWGDSITLRVIVTALAKPEATLDYINLPHLPVSPTTALTVVGAVAFLLLAWVWTRIAFSLLGIEEGHYADVGLGSPLLCLAVSACAGVALLAYNPRAARGEPLLRLLEVVPTANLLDWDSNRVVAALADRQSALDYPPVLGAGSRKNVIIVLSDSVRADRLPVYGYGRQTAPFLSSLVAQGKAAKVDMVLSTCSESYCGIASVLAGAPFYKLSPQNFQLSAVLKRAGYRVSYYLAGDHRSWRFLWDSYAHDVDDLRDCVNRGCRDENDDAEVVADLRQIAPYDGTPRFIFVFLMSSHIFGVRHDAFKQFEPAPAGLQVAASRLLLPPESFDAEDVPQFPPLAPKDAEELSNHYDNGVLQADAMIGSIFEALGEKGYLANSLAMISSDHGEALGEHGHVSHARFLYQKEMSVPLLIYDSDLTAYKNLSYATHMDIAPTILDRLGLPIPASWGGVPLTRADTARRTIHQSRRRERPCAAAVHRSDTRFRKYIRCRFGGARISEELFDLNADPAETRNIVREVPENELAAFRAETQPFIDGTECSGYDPRVCVKR